MTDIVDRLRRWTHDPQVPPASDLMDEAADEIVRLRLADAEREAIADAADRYAEITPESAETAATLRCLLERMAAANSGDDRRSVGGEHAGSAARDR